MTNSMLRNERFQVNRKPIAPTPEQWKQLMMIAEDLDTLLIFMDGDNSRLLELRAQEADTDPTVWLIRALNLQADVDGGRARVTRTMTLLPLKEE